MIEIDDKIISREIFQKEFICDLSKCKGACCVEGDSGAPLLKSEIEVLKKVYPRVEEYMTEEGKNVINKTGVFVVDHEGDLTTPLVNNEQCAFVFEDNGISKCAIEKAHSENKIDFKKPISCHLYPIRITEFKKFDAINYEPNRICSPACKLGQEMQVSVFKFLKEPLIRKYGEDFYNELEEVNKVL
tara:strand:- start:198 stop:758 length:561 start_codon:yes stop_codon:yes gene_type:complete